MDIVGSQISRWGTRGTNCIFFLTQNYTQNCVFKEAQAYNSSALSVPKVVSLPLISHLFETSMNSSAQSSAVCRKCFYFFYFQCKISKFPYIVNKMSCDNQVIAIAD